MRARILNSILALFVVATMAAAQKRPTNTTLDIYAIDVEGAKSVLYVAPSGESVLIDTGNAAPANARDVARIMAAVKDAGVTQIDHVIISHWHSDHFGGLTELAKVIPIKEFIDHGPNMQPTPQSDEFVQRTYPSLYANAKHRIVKPGDVIPIPGLNWIIVSSAGQVLTSPLPGAGKPNPNCASYKPGEANAEDPQSVGSYITFGKFRAIDLSDLTKNKEFELMCPNNLIGSVDLLMVAHHGIATSNSPVLVNALHPRVAIMNNGTRKGGEPETMEILHSSPGLEDIWQMHFSLLGGQEYNTPGMFISNTTDDHPTSMPILPIPASSSDRDTPPPQHNGAAYWIKVSARADGTFTVTNARNGFSKTYQGGK